MKFQPAFRKPLPQHVQQLTSLILTVAMNDRIVCITLERTCRKLSLHPRIERVVKKKIRRVTHWQNGNMVLRWMASAFLRTEKRFNKIMGYRDLWTLEAILNPAQHASAEVAA